MKRQILFLTAAVAVLAGSCGCNRKAPGAAGGGPPGGMSFQVVAVQAQKRPVVETLSLVGDLAANESVEIKAESDGIVQDILFDEGQRVEKGHLLLRLDESKFSAVVDEAEANFKLSQANFERAKQLLQDKLVSQQEFEQTAAVFGVNQATLELKRRLLRDARVLAPFSGITGARHVSPGQVIARNTILITLVDLDTVKVEVNVPERFLSQLRVGQPIQFTVSAHPGRQFQGEVYFIASQLDLATRTALVKTRVPNPGGLLKGGMVASLELKLQIRESAILVPEVALVSNGDQYFVFVVSADQKAVFRRVTVGQRLPRWVEITSGIEAGEVVVVEGHQKIGPGMPLQVAPPERAAIYQTLDLRTASTNAAAER